MLFNCHIQVWVKWKYDNYMFHQSLFLWKASSWESGGKQNFTADCYICTCVPARVNFVFALLNWCYVWPTESYQIKMLNYVEHFLFVADRVWPLWEQSVCLPHPQISNVRVHDQFCSQAKTAAWKIHDEQCTGKLHHTAGNCCFLGLCRAFLVESKCRSFPGTPRLLINGSQYIFREN